MTGATTAGSSAVALLSGGLDSGVALALWLETGNRISRCLCADYGQPAAAAERRASAALAARFELPWEALELPWLGTVAAAAGSALARDGAAIPTGRAQAAPGDAETAAAVWVPARNLVLVAAAAAWAEADGARAVLVGFNREEAATFPDNSAEFVARCNATLALGTRRGDVRVEAPTAELDKPAIVAAARRLGLGRSLFWSCYRPGPDPCGQCESCLRSARAWGES